MSQSRAVLLLRGVNVGGANKVVMADLRELLTGLGLADVVTVGNSGNAVFATDASTHLDTLAQTVTTALAEHLEVTSSCVVRTDSQVRAALAGDPFTDLTVGVDKAGSRMLLLFTSADPTATQLARHDPRTLDPARVALGARVIYQWCPGGILAAPDVSTAVRRGWGVEVTGRNRNTVEKLVARFDT
ncbi:MAG: DUF1697 domain-containing protein [Mycobacteriaceae bacterium]